MARFFLRFGNYLKCYGKLAPGFRPKSLEACIDYCADRPVLMEQVRSEILQLANLLQELVPLSSLEIGTNCYAAGNAMCGGKILQRNRERVPAFGICRATATRNATHCGNRRSDGNLWAGCSVHAVRLDGNRAATEEESTFGRVELRYQANGAGGYP